MSGDAWQRWARPEPLTAQEMRELIARFREAQSRPQTAYIVDEPTYTAMREHVLTTPIQRVVRSTISAALPWLRLPPPAPRPPRFEDPTARIWGTPVYRSPR